MARTTIDFGIDLGTTNSSIAVLKGTGTEVFKNNDGQEYTPSAVWIDGKGRLYTGQQAKNRLGIPDMENTKTEFKRQMGTSELFDFPVSGRQMSPEHLSAEILKSLRGDVQQRTGEEVTATVIGVPAIFDAAQNKATMKAAELAGLSHTALIQEPVAAAMAYSFQSESDRVFWLVYDLGGGTFDAAIIHYRDGQIRVVGHDGDRQMGGKDIDWAIVDSLLAPALKKQYALPNFTRGNKRWESIFTVLKFYAELAKIRLSRDKETLFEIATVLQDSKGNSINFEYELQRSDVELLIEPVVMKSITICKKILDENRLSSGDIEKVILVGGPTNTPILRQILTDQLGIPLEFGVDPLTIVARGAAVFAGTQKMRRVTSKSSLTSGQYMVELDYQPIGTDLEPLIGGRVVAKEGEPIGGFTIEFVEEKIPWKSGKIKLNDNGTFMTSIFAQKGYANEFLIQLRDEKGKLCKTIPDRFTYTIGATVSEQILQISMGVALTNGEMWPLIKKGQPLPARKRDIFRSTTAVKKGESGTFLRVPVVQGENTRHADGNLLIGKIEVHGDSIRRDLPVGSEVEVTIEMDESQQVRARAFVPILDEEFQEVLDLQKILKDPEWLTVAFKKAKERLKELGEKRRAMGGSKAEQFLQETQIDQITHDVETNLAAAEVDPDARQKCQQELLNLQNALDSIEDELQWPALVSEAEKYIEDRRNIVKEHGNQADQNRFSSLETEIKNAIYAHDADLLRLKLAELYNLMRPIIMEQPWFWVTYLDYLADKSQHMTNRVLAERLISQGRHAIDTNDLDGLKEAVRQLIDLLPPDEQESARSYGSTIMK